MIFKSFPKFHARHEGLAFYGPRKSDEGAVNGLILIFASLTRYLQWWTTLKYCIGLLFSYPSLYIIVMLSCFSFLSH